MGIGAEVNKQLTDVGPVTGKIILCFPGQVRPDSLQSTKAYCASYTNERQASYSVYTDSY